MFKKCKGIKRCFGFPFFPFICVDFCALNFLKSASKFFFRKKNEKKWTKSVFSVTKLKRKFSKKVKILFLISGSYKKKNCVFLFFFTIFWFDQWNWPPQFGGGQIQFFRGWEDFFFQNLPASFSLQIQKM